VSRDRLNAPSGGIAVIDTLGKWNMHRFVNPLAVLRIPLRPLRQGPAQI
jgi:hypothetical protein